MTWNSVLVYVKGGAVLARFDTGIYATPAAGFTNHKYALGYAAGGGWEYAFDPKWSIKAEYLYLGFDSNSIAATGYSTGFGRVPVVSQEFGTTTLQGIHTAKVGLNYKWDWMSMLR